jgi:hypothetical protein
VATGKLRSSSVVRLPGGPLEARPDLTMTEWALLCRIDGHRPLAALANHSGRSQREAVALAERLLATGLLELAANPVEDGAARQAGSAEQEQNAPDDAGPVAGVEPGPADDEAAAEAEPDVAGRDTMETAEAAPPGQARIDPVSLLRELAADATGAATATAEPEATDEEPEAPDGESLAELAAQLAGGGRQAQGADPEAAGNERPGGEEQPARAPGRGADQADIMREFASLAMGGEPSNDPGPAPDPGDEAADDERGRGRFGFRRGQRR